MSWFQQRQLCGGHLFVLDLALAWSSTKATKQADSCLTTRTFAQKEPHCLDSPCPSSPQDSLSQNLPCPSLCLAQAQICTRSNTRARSKSLAKPPVVLINDINYIHMHLVYRFQIWTLLPHWNLCFISFYRKFKWSNFFFWSTTKLWLTFIRIHLRQCIKWSRDASWLI